MFFLISISTFRREAILTCFTAFAQGESTKVFVTNSVGGERGPLTESRLPRLRRALDHKPSRRYRQA
jgi:hypothetical protein